MWTPYQKSLSSLRNKSPLCSELPIRFSSVRQFGAGFFLLFDIDLSFAKSRRSAMIIYKRSLPCYGGVPDSHYWLRVIAVFPIKAVSNSIR